MALHFFIGFSGNYSTTIVGAKKKVNLFSGGVIKDHISSQSVKCNIDDIQGLSTPFDDFFLSDKAVTGVIMAVEIIVNRDPEPNNPSDYLIGAAVLKCADGELYLADFALYKFVLPARSANVNLPSNDAFGEGDIVTVMQATSVSKEYWTFLAYHKEREVSDGTQ